MADDLNQPYIGYRSAGRRRPELNDRRASADAPLAALRGLASGVLGAPGDIESLVRMLPGLSEQTVLPTSRDVEARLPLRSVSQTLVGRAATELGTLGGGFYTGPGSPLRAIASIPAAVSHGAGEFARAAGGAGAHVVKPKGGNWLAGSVERAIEPMIPRTGAGNRMARETLAEMDKTYPPEVLATMSPETLAQVERGYEWLRPNVAVQDWLEKKLAKYIRNEMATPEDPVRALAERGVTHAPIEATGYNVSRARREAGFPEEGLATSPMAKLWEDRADTFVNALRASDLTGHYPDAVKANPWLLKVPPETPVYEMLQGSEGQFGGLGFGHLVDELKNAINPASGLPENLRLKYSDLEKVTVPQAVERVAKINEWRAANKAEADAARAMNPATHTVKEYPDQGFKWVELKTGDLPEGWTQKNSAFYDPTGERHVHPGAEALADALKYEGETMGHCVGGYCPDVLEGRSRIYSLRDKKGQPHVTIETRPMENYELEAAKMKRAGASPEEIAAFFENPPQEIVQIKGKANRAPNPEYLPAVQDFVRSGKWSKVGDLQNVGLIPHRGEYRFPEEFLYRTDAGGWEPLVDVAKRAFPDNPEMQSNFYRGASQMEGDIKLKSSPELGGGTGLTPGARGEGFNLGGLVQKYADGGLVGSNIYNSDAMQDPSSAYRFADGGQAGDVRAYADGGLVANSPTADFDPARIDAIVGDLNALNAG